VKDVLKRGVLEPGTVRLCTECSFVGVVSRRKEVCVFWDGPKTQGKRNPLFLE